MNLYKIDEVIDCLCDYVIKLTKETGLNNAEKVAENTKALAALTSARANALF